MTICWTLRATTTNFQITSTPNLAQSSTCGALPAAHPSSHAGHLNLHGAAAHLPAAGAGALNARGVQVRKGGSAVQHQREGRGVQPQREGRGVLLQSEGGRGRPVLTGDTGKRGLRDAKRGLLAGSTETGLHRGGLARPGGTGATEMWLLFEFINQSERQEFNIYSRDIL